VSGSAGRAFPTVGSVFRSTGPAFGPGRRPADGGPPAAVHFFNGGSDMTSRLLCCVPWALAARLDTTTVYSTRPPAVHYHVHNTSVLPNLAPGSRGAHHQPPEDWLDQRPGDAPRHAGDFAGDPQTGARCRLGTGLFRAGRGALPAPGRFS